MKKNNFLICFLSFLVIIFIVISPKSSIEACLKGINVWASTLLPALFPFLFLTKLLSETGVIEKLGQALSPITKKLFNVPGIGGYVFAMGIISGYPVSAKITSDLYKNNYLTKGQACRITSFTSTSGPLFIIGSVGIGMFYNQKLGAIILVSHILGAILNGLIYRNYLIDFDKPISTPQKTNVLDENYLENSMFSAIKSVLIIGGYVSFFFMIISLINDFNLLYPINFVLSKILPLSLPTISSITNGIIEVTKGCLDLSVTDINIRLMCVLATGIISFGGISIFLQALTFLKSFGISTKYYFTLKLSQTLISCLIAFGLSFIL